MSRWASILAKPCWRVADIVRAKPNSPIPSDEMLKRLATLSGLTSVSPTLRKDLVRQLSWLNNLSQVDTQGVEPLCRLSAPQTLDLEKDEPADFETWEPLSLAAKSVGPYYVVNTKKDHSEL